MAIGFSLPFSKSTGSIGHFETSATPIVAAGENIKSLLLTNWGERVCHYNLGCNLREFLFENVSTEEMKSKIADRIFDQIETWIPYVTISQLNILLNEDDPTVPENTIRIRMTFALTSSPSTTSRVDVEVIR